ncbi:MFS general substrate transporter [Saccharata proteae CBS 121410]|uniref:MFS general substrate transporter n=1 Tax=Saccharata proteae CBS 121410 TaxID=1314787 RepID=A0A6A5YAW2_9PEZI|nr:MFS general substrate transporter [Saccharata proteae CBS 121410]
MVIDDKIRSEKLDAALSEEAVAGLDGTWTVEEETAVRRKLDWHVLPVVTVLYLLCFLDRNARIQGLDKDLGLAGYDFNWALTVFFVTYILIEIPSNIMLKRVGPRAWIPFLTAGFGFVSLCIAFTHNFADLCTARAFLGIFEGGMMPGVAFFLSCFYKRKELLFRVGIYVSSASLAGAFGGLLAAGLTRVPEWGVASMRIHTWRNIFFFEGMITMLAGMIAPIFMVSSPEKCGFLTERQRFIAAERILLDHKTSAYEQVKTRDVKRAIFNINNAICTLGFLLINITVQGISLFMPTLLNDLGWTATKAQLYTVPPYVTASVGAICIAFISDRTRQRGIYLAFCATLSITGFAILLADHDANTKYMAIFFVTLGAWPGGPGFISWGLNNAGGSAVRAVTGAWISGVGTLGALVATWSYLPNDAPNYPIGHSINLSAHCCICVLALCGVAYCYWENRVRDKGGRDKRVLGLTEGEARELGYRHPEFRYIP